MATATEGKTPHLRRTIGSWSGGTRIEIVGRRKNVAVVRILAGDKPVMDVDWTDIVWRRRAA